MVLGLLSLAAAPAAYAASRYLARVTLIQGAAAMPAAGVLGIGALVLARRGRRQVQRTLGRVGEERIARLGNALGLVGLCIGITAGIALGVYGLLSLFAAD